MCSANARPAACISELVILCFDLLLELGNAEFSRTVSFVKQCFFTSFGNKDTTFKLEDLALCVFSKKPVSSIHTKPIPESLSTAIKN